MTDRKVKGGKSVVAGDSAAPSVESAIPEPALSMTDLHRLMMANERVEKALLAVGSKQQEDRLDELEFKLQQERLQRLQAEFTLRRVQRMNELQTLSRVQGQAIQAYETVKAELAVAYSVDFSKVAVDDETGRLTLLP